MTLRPTSGSRRGHGPRRAPRPQDHGGRAGTGPPKSAPAEQPAAADPSPAAAGTIPAEAPPDPDEATGPDVPPDPRTSGAPASPLRAGTGPPESAPAEASPDEASPDGTPDSPPAETPGRERGEDGGRGDSGGGGGGKHYWPLSLAARTGGGRSANTIPADPTSEDEGRAEAAGEEESR